MYIEYAETARMSQTGSSLLRAIQNNSTPVLDLLVRESIQNSLDASDGERDYVSVNFTTGDFDSDELAEKLDGITDKLKNKFEERESFISIEDYHTQGLSGPMNYDEVRDNEYGNLIKLVYEISKPQSKEGAGGSWGLGKTVYFRVGIGLVIYYSRVKIGNGKYQSRMAACLVENEKSNDALLKRPSKNIERGIAWWGDRITDNGKETQPITDVYEINKLLSIFGMKEYSGDRTGTMVIIPYTSDEKLLKELYLQDVSEDNHTNNPFWVHSIEDYLKLSLQKWYHPRIHNTKYKFGKYLRASINCKEITRENFYPYFRIMQDLYNCAVEQTEEMASFPQLKAEIKKVDLRNVLSESSHAGTLAHIEVNEELLRMQPPDNLPSPYDFLSLFNEDISSNPLIIGFTRKTGMIVSYEIMGPWTDNTPKSEPGKYILAFFVLNSLNKLKVGNRPMSLEEYVRQGEQADHTSWSDWTLSSGNPYILTKIQGHIRKTLTNTYKQIKDSPIFIEDKGMGREFAKFLLPPTGYGRGSSIGIVKPIKIERKSKKTSIDIGSNPIFLDGNIIFDFNLNIPKYKAPIEITLKAITEQMGMKADDWEKEDSIGSIFPVKIKAVEIDSLKINDNDVVYPTVSSDQETVNMSRLKIRHIKTKRFNQRYGIKVFMDDEENKDSSVKMQGKLICMILDPQMRVAIDLLEESSNG